MLNGSKIEVLHNRDYFMTKQINRHIDKIIPI